jgi:hypothetical protein
MSRNDGRFNMDRVRVAPIELEVSEIIAFVGSGKSSVETAVVTVLPDAADILRTRSGGLFLFDPPHERYSSLGNSAGTSKIAGGEGPTETVEIT